MSKTVKAIVNAVAAALGWIIAFGVGIGVCATSKLYAMTGDYEPLKNTINDVDEVINKMAEKELNKVNEED